ncbi:hypothetical protein EON67_03480 [archaeon]|nr:MAG: hypothetical protein EON67_03480 [archaeon]
MQAYICSKLERLSVVHHDVSMRRCNDHIRAVAAEQAASRARAHTSSQATTQTAGEQILLMQDGTHTACAAY